jgi:hypothetical protein
VAHIDGRAQARTSNGHYVFVHQEGVLKVDDALGKVLTWAEDAKATEFEDYHFFSGPKFETSVPGLKWIEDAVLGGPGEDRCG